MLPERNVRNFIFKGGFPQVPQDGLRRVGNSSVQGDGNSVYSANAFVMICE